jgi:hypothetical protein
MSAEPVQVRTMLTTHFSAFTLPHLGLALFPGVLEVGDLIIRSHNHDLPAFFLKFSNITVAEFRAPFES